jgi:hypothetical protein
MERLKIGPPGRMFKNTRLYFELMICDKYRRKNTGRQSVNFPTRWKLHEPLQNLYKLDYTSQTCRSGAQASSHKF